MLAAAAPGPVVILRFAQNDNWCQISGGAGSSRSPALRRLDTLCLAPLATPRKIRNSLKQKRHGARTCTLQGSRRPRTRQAESMPEARILLVILVLDTNKFPTFAVFRREIRKKIALCSRDGAKIRKKSARRTFSVNNSLFWARNRPERADRPGKFSEPPTPRRHNRNCGTATRFYRRA